MLGYPREAIERSTGCESDYGYSFAITDLVLE
jgi:hypothetical protein